MPVRLLSSSVIKWPDRDTVDSAVRAWVKEVLKQRKDVIRIGYFGSFAKGNFGFGSDIDIVIVVNNSDKPFLMRSVEWDTSQLPVPVDLIIYTENEWKKITDTDGFGQVLMRESIWIYER